MMKNLNRRQFLQMSSLLAAGLAVPACGSPPATSEPQKAAGNETESIKLGGTLPLTGPFSDTGQWIEHGYQYWAEEINAKGGLLGRPVELIIRDDASDPEKAAMLLEQLITEDKVDLLLGGYPGTSASMQMPVAESHKMVYVSMGGHMPSFEQGFTYSFGGPPLMGQWWYEGFWQWVESLPEAERPKKAAVITVNNAVGLAVRPSSLDGAERLGIEVVMDELYDLPLESADELVTKAKDYGADLFFANGFFPDGVVTVKAMKSFDYNPRFFVQCVGSTIPDWTKELGEDGNYAFSGTAIHSKLPFEGIEALNQVTKEKYEAEQAPQYFLFGYAWLQTLQVGVEGAGSLDQTAIRDYLKSHEVATIGGSFNFDERGLPSPYSYLTQIQPTGVELVWPSEVQSAEPIYPKPAWSE